ncbi:hypothetical protein EUGRSUZ_L02435 [Eucalyptus grandis]|uniref:1-aminocyclopropane-1-carboxylate synthase n=2 Tax=Eucalyptus grandis TaxID=71139 RepID=A0AAD9T9M2_EUCGR|nr:hypothetical protein EUGRSUZ_L02435 [Eucalyptus grandis]
MSYVLSNGKPLLSQKATNDGHAENSPYFDGWKAYDSDPFHPTQNPSGVIQMGLAEHQLCFNLVQKWLENNPEASICTKEGVDKFRDIAIFQDYHGLPEFDRDLCWRTGVRLLPVVCHSSNNFKVTRKALEEAYAKAVEANITVKGLLITNPSNPLGTILDRDTLREAMSFINEKNIHLVCDEIYAATVFRQPDFISIAEIIEEDQEYNRDLVHIIYSLSKDMGFPGFRVGIVYSYNDAVVECGRKMSSFGLVSSQTQNLIASMLSDDQFIEKFLLESAGRLATRHKDFTDGLRQVGIKCLNSNAGLFLWMDLKGFLRESTVEAETALWRVIINDVKLNVSPGSSFHCSEPGWFRICIANMNEETMKVALARIQKFVQRNGDKLNRKEKCWQSDLRLRLSFRRMDDVLRSPCSMSPHSPIPQSPLVRART